MKTKRIKGYDIVVPKASAFTYETPEMMPKSHTSTLFVGARGAGKTLSAVNMLKNMNYDRIFVISPSVKSNKAIMDMLNLDDSDVYDDPDDLENLDKIIAEVNKERDDLEEYEEKIKNWSKFQKKLQNPMFSVPDSLLMDYYNPATGNFEKPQHRYGGKKPHLALLIDDCMGSLLFTKGIRKLNNLFIKHRHIAPFKKGSALGISLYPLVQSYIAQSGGISKCIRGNITSMILFKTKNLKELDQIATEMAGEVSKETFFKIYEDCYKDKYDFMMIDLHKKKEHPSMFRRNFNEFLMYQE